jgi:hypothetical protein
MFAPFQRKLLQVKRLQQDKPSLLEGQLSKRGTAILVVIFLAIAIAADQLRPGWGRSAGTTAGVFAAASVMWPQFRREWWFWFTLLPLFALQVIVFVRFQGFRLFVEQAAPAVWFLLGLADFVCVATAVVLIAQFARRRKGTGCEKNEHSSS